MEKLSGLAITRKMGESVLIGDAKVKVIQTGKVVRLLINAPKDTLILREELVKCDDSTKGG